MGGDRYDAGQLSVVDDVGHRIEDVSRDGGGEVPGGIEEDPERGGGVHRHQLEGSCVVCHGDTVRRCQEVELVDLVWEEAALFIAVTVDDLDLNGKGVAVSFDDLSRGEGLA